MNKQQFKGEKISTVSFLSPNQTCEIFISSDDIINFKNGKSNWKTLFVFLFIYLLASPNQITFS